MWPSAERWLLLGALAGFGLALVDALGLSAAWSSKGVPDGVAVQVGDGQILQAELDRALEALARDKRNPVEARDQQRVLDALITEELLVQRAQLIGLADSDRAVRKALVDSMLQYVLAQAGVGEPDEASLRAYYEQHPALALPAMRVRLRHGRVPMAEAAAVAERLAAGAPFATQFPDQGALVPDEVLPLPALDNYLPAALIQRVKALESGDIGGPVEIGDQAHFVWIQTLQRPPRPDFSAVRDLVRHQWLREQREQATQAYVQGLRQQTSVRLHAALLNP